MEFENPTRPLGHVEGLDRKESLKRCVTDTSLFEHGIFKNILHYRRNERCVPFERLWLLSATLRRRHRHVELDEVFHRDKLRFRRGRVFFRLFYFLFLMRVVGLVTLLWFVRDRRLCLSLRRRRLLSSADCWYGMF